MRSCITSLKKVWRFRVARFRSLSLPHRQVCNHPSLVYDECKNASDGGDLFSTGLAQFPAEFDPAALNVELSGKLQCLDHILRHVQGGC